MSARNRSFFHFFSAQQFAAISARLQAREQQAQKALSEAINEAATRSVTLSVNEWDTMFKIEKGYASNKIKVLRKATPRHPEALVVARSRATRADNFKYQVMAGRKGVKLNVRRGRSGGVIKNAFVIPRAKSNGKPLILERLQKYQKGEARNFRHDGKTEGRWGRARNPRFKALYGPSVNQHFHDSRQRVAPQAMSAAKQQFMKAIGNE